MSEPDARPPACSEQAVQELLERRASDNERVVSALRIGLVCTVLSSAALNTDLLLRELRDTDGAQGAASSEVAEALAEDLSQVNDFVRAIRERAWGELSALHEPAPVDPRATVHSVFRELEGRFEARFALRDDTDGARVLVAGGEPTLRRILRNLVVNACEGDGARAAARVEVRFARTNSARGVEVAVEDDGPGFRSDVLREEPGSRATTKSGGSGLGLLLVETLLGPHAASLRRSNRDEGGARVSFELPEAPV